MLEDKIKLADLYQKNFWEPIWGISAENQFNMVKEFNLLKTTLKVIEIRYFLRSYEVKSVRKEDNTDNIITILSQNSFALQLSKDYILIYGHNMNQSKSSNCN